ncbi:indole-3-glycerol phosphate synthase TrpC [Cytobacillus spongiae]|uniref:indole-3-glycerol phosphate synthase TrpC n=1 Tax=Cytobacillus spongiae TaxID=2901381 RepID=UPI001F3191E1|nr:indole-3-glycerol phosphate synthase TrpC [Cytobacillus spongiae]UII54376.1 indole-3-glycerol phosphate synthase TrpC [Cytobacillus spongiae]
MTTILHRILEEKELEVQQLKTLDNGEQPANKYTHYSFIEILRAADQVAIIAEFKRASPSKGDINLLLSPSDQGKDYVAAGADAISVLTDAPFFKGAVADLEEVRKVVDVPILCKDFIIDEVQIDRAKRVGANIILLIVAALSPNRLAELYQYALSQQLEILIEVHSEEEAILAIGLGAKLIGVNNRNLKTFEVDLKTTEALAPLIKQAGAYLISESGIRSVDDVKRVVKAGANGILVGEAFMKHENVTQMMNEMKISLKAGK